MRTFSPRSRIVVLGSCLSVWALLAACEVEDENPATTRNRGTGSTLDGSAQTGDGSATPTGAPICGKYGNYDGVKAIAAEIVATAKADCRISPEIQQAERERGKNFKECFEQFVGSGFQCAGVSFVLGQTKDSENKPCNSQMPGVQFTNLDFTTLTKDIGTALKAKGLTDDEIRLLAPVFEGARLKLVNNNSNNKHALCASNCESGGEACIQPPQDAGKDVQNPPPDSGGADSGSDADSG